MSTISIDKTILPRSKASRVGRIITLITVPLFAFVGFIYIYALNPVTQTSLFFPCVFHSFTGLYCPGCGNTRALHALVHFDLLGMLHYNLLFPFLFFILCWLFAGEYINLLIGRRILWLPKRVPLVLTCVMCLVVIAFTILRNVPIYPFNLLAPGV